MPVISRTSIWITMQCATKQYIEKRKHSYLTTRPFLFFNMYLEVRACIHSWYSHGLSTDLPDILLPSYRVFLWIPPVSFVYSGTKAAEVKKALKLKTFIFSGCVIKLGESKETHWINTTCIVSDIKALNEK